MSIYNFDNKYNNSFVKPRLFKGIIRNLIIANAIVFLLTTLLRPIMNTYAIFGLVPKLVWTNGFIWQFFTYMFMHGSFSHILINMFILWMFGMELENYWGKKEFLKYYLITGIGSGFLTFLFSMNSTIPVVGASGAIYGLLLAFGLMFPERKIYIYFLIPVRAKYFVMIMGAITFFSSISPNTSNISHLTHLGGLIVGYVYLRKNMLWKKIISYFPNIKFTNPFKNIIRKSKINTNSDYQQTAGYNTDETMREQVDIILDKINLNGYDSLSEQDKRTLFLASQYFAHKEKKKD